MSGPLREPVQPRAVVDLRDVHAHVYDDGDGAVLLITDGDGDALVEISIGMGRPDDPGNVQGAARLQVGIARYVSALAGATP